MQDDSMDEKNIDKLLSNKKRFTTEALKRAVAREDYSRLEGLAELADRQGCSRALRKKAWMLIALQMEHNHNPLDACKAWNRARIIDLTNKKFVEGVFRNLSLIYSEVKFDMSQSDLANFKYPVERLVQFYKVNGLWNDPGIQVGRHMLDEIVDLEPTAKVVIETRASHTVAKLAELLDQDVSIEEVRADVARILAPILREMIDKGSKSKKSEKDGKKRKKRKKKKDNSNDPSQKNSNSQ